MFGLLNIAKPSGVTSRDVVNHIQRLVKPHKAGHAGTLDPLATGVLLVCVGKATRLIDYIHRMPKRYLATFLLGRHSETEDVEGHVVELERAPRPSEKQIETALGQFTGEIRQRPPAYSALKVGGKRAYQLARQGAPVVLEPRGVTIFELQLVRYEYPRLTLDIACGSGTYVRSLGRDLAESLGSAAVMSALARTAIGDFTIEDAVPMNQVSSQTLSEYLQPATRAVAFLPKIELTEAEEQRLGNGLSIENSRSLAHAEIAAVDRTGELISILAPKEPRLLKPLRNFRAV